MFNLVVSNIPGPLQPLDMLGCRLEEPTPVVPLVDEHAASVGVTTVSGEACFGEACFGVDREALPGADRLAAAIVESVDELRELPALRRRPASGSPEQEP